jgi:RimJ/RimL family protein N-acetyltransferase
VAAVNSAHTPVTDGVVSLRDWTEADVPALVSALEDREVSRWLPRIPYPYTEAHAREAIRSYNEEREAGRGLYLAVTDVRSATVQGWVGMSIDSDESVGNAGYWMKQEARGQGRATRSLGLLVACAFEELLLERIEVRADVDNVASQRVAEKAGFTREGRLRSAWRARDGRRDCYLYSLLASDPR